MSNLIHDVSDATLEADVMQAQGLVLIDFWAPWCGPCKMIAPTLQELAADQQGQLKVCKLNVDDNPLTAKRFEVRGIPTLVLMKNGAELEREVGLVSKSRLWAWLDKWVAA